MGDDPRTNLTTALAALEDAERSALTLTAKQMVSQGQINELTAAHEQVRAAITEALSGLGPMDSAEQAVEAETVADA